jgi:hypothetical protein
MHDNPKISSRQSSVLKALDVSHERSLLELLVEPDLAELSSDTLKRELRYLGSIDLIEKIGDKRGSAYRLTRRGLIHTPYDVSTYTTIHPELRNARKEFNAELFNQPYVSPFTEQDLTTLEKATRDFEDLAIGSTSTSHQKELMRFLIEFSWKSSEIEGNTYDIFSTEQLLLYGDRAPGHTEGEVQMILNHKTAFDDIYHNPDEWKALGVPLLESLHSKVSHKLGISKNIRKLPVGITGSAYRPLAKSKEIRTALENLCGYINSAPTPFDKAISVILGISYIQPFEDGNKRTSRLAGNALLYRAGCAPISYRAVSARDYKIATLIFYEKNSMRPFKDIFMEQYLFAARNYNISRPKP